jgi:hypothetical protein
MTDFQKAAVDKIRHMGGAIFFTAGEGSRGEWRSFAGSPVLVPSSDFKTEGRLGWPTVQALLNEKALYHKGGNEYRLTGDASELARAA